MEDPQLQDTTKQQQHSTTTTVCSKPWLRNLCQVDWTCVAFVLVLGIATGLIQKTPAVQRPVFLSDATIAYPLSPDSSIAFWLALFVPFVVLALSAAVLEFVVFKRQGNRQAAMMLLNVLLSMLAALAVVGFMTELFKRICGRPRPDFLARCQPAPPPPGGGVTVAPVCTAARSTYTLQDGLFSFPSGHASCSMAVGLFASMYLLWAVHARDSRDTLGVVAVCSRNSNSNRLCLRTYLRAELLRLVVMLLVLFELAWAWGVSISRFRDNRHNVSDVVGGMLLAVCFTPMFVVRLVWHANGWAQIERQEAACAAAAGHHHQLELSNSHSGAPVLPVAAVPSHALAGSFGGGGCSNGGAS